MPVQRGRACGRGAHAPSLGRGLRARQHFLLLSTCVCVSPAGGSLTKLAYYSTVQHKVARVRSFDLSGQVSLLGVWVAGSGLRAQPRGGQGVASLWCRPGPHLVSRLPLLCRSPAPRQLSSAWFPVPTPLLPSQPLLPPLTLPPDRSTSAAGQRSFPARDLLPVSG